MPIAGPGIGKIACATSEGVKRHGGKAIFQAPMNSEIQARLRVLQMIAGALIMGVAAFAAIAVVVGGGQNAQPPGSSAAGGGSMIQTLRLVAGAVMMGGIIGAVAFMAFNRKSAAQLRQYAGATAHEDELQSQLFGRFFVGAIISMALLEGPALFGAVIVLMGGNAMDLVLVAIPVAAMVATFPTTGKWERFSQRRSAGELEPFHRR